MSEPALTRADQETLLRAEVRAFLAAHRRDDWPEHADLPLVSAAFSRLMGANGFIGAHWPECYGGGGRDAYARYAIFEETLAAGAPTMAHMVAERQTGPLLLRYGSEAQRDLYLPRIVRGECFFCIGMSEPGAGSDLAALRTRGVRVDGGYLLQGSKLWTSLAHVSHYCLVLCRTSDSARHDGLSQLIVDLQSPGVTVRPVLNLLGEHEFNELFFDDVFVPEENLVGIEGQGWRQAMSELAFERGGPDRFLSNFALFAQAIDVLRATPSEIATAEVGRLTARLAALRHMARGVFEALSTGRDASLDAALVKDMGSSFEQDVAETLRRLLPLEARLTLPAPFRAQLNAAIMRAPSHSIRGGAREVLRGLVAKALAEG